MKGKIRKSKAEQRPKSDLEVAEILSMGRASIRLAGRSVGRALVRAYLGASGSWLVEIKLSNPPPLEVRRKPLQNCASSSVLFGRFRKKVKPWPNSLSTVGRVHVC